MTSLRVHDVQSPGSRVGSYVNAGSIEEVLSLLTQHGSRARIVAGGTDLLLELERRDVADLDVLIDISRIEGMDAIYEAKDRVNIGPLVTHNQAALDVSVQRSGLPLAQACIEIGSPALRNRATIIGNVVTASPANDTVSALRALDAVVSLASERGMRSISLSEFHTGVRQSVLAADEMVTGISFASLGPHDRGIFVKLGLRRAQAISVVHGTIVLRLASEGAIIDSAHIALGSVAPTIIDLALVEQLLVGKALSESLIVEAAALAQTEVDPISDLRSTADYRRDLVGVVVSRALHSLHEQTQRSTFPASLPVLGGPSVLADRVRGELGVGDTVRAVVNGKPVEGPWSSSTMLEWLRDAASLTGTKEGCAEGECGACTVYLNGAAVLSCLVPCGRVDGATVTTIEGLHDPLGERFVEESAVQCGYCIPGFVMAGAALRDECGLNPTPDQVKIGLAGNLCRCTGYYPIERAVGGPQ